MARSELSIFPGKPARTYKCIKMCRLFHSIRLASAWNSTGRSKYTTWFYPVTGNIPAVIASSRSLHVGNGTFFSFNLEFHAVQWMYHHNNKILLLGGSCVQNMIFELVHRPVTVTLIKYLVSRVYQVRSRASPICTYPSTVPGIPSTALKIFRRIGRRSYSFPLYRALPPSVCT